MLIGTLAVAVACVFTRTSLVNSGVVSVACVKAASFIRPPGTVVPGGLMFYC